jgi:N-acetylmuramoyl-L-alanine amidase
MKIYIDAGHSTKTGDPGATSGSFIEYDINCKVAKACNDYLKANYTCDTILDYDTSTSGNISKSISNKCDAFLCIHHNAGGGDGCEVYYWTGDARAKALAESVINEFKAIGQNSRGVKMSTKSAYNFAPCRENSKAGIKSVTTTT